jgi:hypothetical protein
MVFFVEKYRDSERYFAISKNRARTLVPNARSRRYLVHILLLYLPILGMVFFVEKYRDSERYFAISKNRARTHSVPKVRKAPLSRPYYIIQWCPFFCCIQTALGRLARFVLLLFLIIAHIF